MRDMGLGPARGLPTLKSVLRRAHLGMALAAVTIVGLSLAVPATVALQVYAGRGLAQAARAMSYTTEAAVVFRDAPAAAEALAAIAASEDVAEASVTGSDGQVLARWNRGSDRWFDRLGDGLARLLGAAPVTAPVRHDGEVVGHVEVRSSGGTLLRFFLAGLLGMAVCQSLIVLGALYFSRRVLARITGPLEALAEVARTVRRQRSFGQRVPAAAIAELNDLGRTFNTLLTELDQWQSVLTDENTRLAHEATHDSLTGLPNRAYFERRLRRALGDADGAGTRVALLLMDCNVFKDVNDRHGHAAGDAVLVGIASRVRAVLRAGDLVVRLGGDEFAVLLDCVPAAADARHVADAIEAGLAAPMALPGGASVVASLSIGIALYPDHAADMAALIHEADLAMYAAKRERARASPDRTFSPPRKATQR